MPNTSKRDNRGKQKKKSTSEIVGVVLIVASVFFLFCLILPFALSVIGEGIRSFLTGILGVFSFALFCATTALGIVMLKGKKLAVPKKRAVYIGLISLFGLMVLQLITTHSILGLSFGEHMSRVYNFSEPGNFSIGGVLFALFPMVVVSITNTVVAYLFFISLFLIFSALLATDIIKFNKPMGDNKRKYNKSRIIRTEKNGYVISSDGGLDLDNVTHTGLFVGEIVSNVHKNNITSGSFSDFSGLDDSNERIQNTGKAQEDLKDFFSFMRENQDNRPTEDTPEARAQAIERLLGDKKGISETDRERFLSNSNNERELVRAVGGTIQSEPMIKGSAEYNNYNEGYVKKSTGRKRSKEKLEVVFQPPLNQQEFYNDNDTIIDGARYSKYIASLDEVQQPPPKQQQQVVYQYSQGPIEKINDNFDNLTKKANAMLNQTIQAEPQIIRQDDIINCSNPVPLASPAYESNTPFSPIPLDLPKIPESYYNDEGIEKATEFNNELPRERVLEIPVINASQNVQAVQEEIFGYSKNTHPKIDREFIPPAYEDDENTYEIKEAKNEVLEEIKETLHTISKKIKNNTGIAAPPHAKQAIQDTLDLLDNEDELDDIINLTTTQNINLAFAEKLKNKNQPDDPTIYLDEDKDDEDDLRYTQANYGTTPYKVAKQQDEEIRAALERDEDYTGSYIKGHNSNPKEFSKSTSSQKNAHKQLHIEDVLSTGKKTPQRPAKKSVKYIRPALDLLTSESTDPATFGTNSAQNAAKLEQKLKSLGLDVVVNGVSHGPAVTRYELTMPAGIPIKKILNYAPDIAYELESKKVRIEAPISGKKAVGVEVPNQKIGRVALKELLASQEFINSPPASVTLCIGKDIAGDIILCPLEKMPHLLIAGATGQGKSVCLNSMIVSMIYKSSPDDLRLILIDPKGVEFPPYQNLPHLLINQIIHKPDHAINAFKWVVNEMQERYKILAAHRVKDLIEYNNCTAVKKGEAQKLPKIVIVVDELGSLMRSYKSEMEDVILALASLARAAGIYMILATQRPSVDVVTGTIKGNLPSRIAFAVSNGHDSKTILDEFGAEMLLGSGDMLYSPIDASEPVRVQGSLITTEEVDQIVKFICENNSADYFDEVAGVILKEKEVEVPDEYAKDDMDDNGFDPLLEEVARKVVIAQQVSTTILQRWFKLGYAKAARLMDQLEEIGFIGPMDPFNKTRPREIYATKELFEKIFQKEFREF